MNNLMRAWLHSFGATGATLKNAFSSIRLPTPSHLLAAMRARWMIVFALLASAQLHAVQYPENGWWWNPAQSGRGFLLERQGNTIFIGAFIYAANGRPEWLVMQGSYVPSDAVAGQIGTVALTVSATANGQCVGCAYVFPSVSTSTQNPASITFAAGQRATLTWPGETISLQRQFWAWRDQVDQLDGNWLLTSVSNGTPTSQIVKITASTGTTRTATIASLTGTSVGSLTLANNALTLTLGTQTLPVLSPEATRFYAGSSTSASLQVVAVRLTDTPFASSTTTSTLPGAFAAFGSNVTIVQNTSAGTLTLEAAGRPDHRSPYWNPSGTSGLYVAPGAETTVASMSPGFIDQYTNRYFLTVPSNPQKATTTTATNLGAIGIAITGSPIFNGQEGPNVNLESGVISGFDNYGAHTGPQVYHYHLEPTPISNDDSKVFAILRDGFFLYGRKCTSVTTNNGHPSDLDASGGHTTTTQYSTTPIYHYHIKNQVYLTVNNKAAYLLFDGRYQGTPNTISN